MSLTRIAALTALSCTLVFAPAASAARVASWGATASTGVVHSFDKRHRATYSYWVRPKSSMPAGAALTLRYSIDMENEGIVPDTWSMKVKFRDRGANEQIVVNLREYNVKTGVSYIRLTLDSNKYSSASGWQIRTVTDTMAGWDFDNTESVYYIEVDLIKTTASGRPDLATLQVTGVIG